jgi:heat shock protein HslJ/uncharacterized membrane protein
MRLRLTILALLAAAASPAAAQPGQPAQPEGQIYAAGGTEPFWDLTFEDGKMIYTFNEERIEVPRPRPVTTRAGVHVYRTSRLTVEISHEGRCNDGMSEYEFSDTVRIRLGRNRTADQGCGGELLAPVTLAGSDWYVVDVNGVIVGGENYVLHFDDAGGLSGQVGCNRFSGPYTQRGHLLVPGPIAATRMACPSDDMSPEARMMQLLHGSVLMNYRGGMILILQENNGGGPAIFATLRRN